MVSSRPREVDIHAHVIFCNGLTASGVCSHVFFMFFMAVYTRVSAPLGHKLVTKFKNTPNFFFIKNFFYLFLFLYCAINSGVESSRPTIPVRVTTDQCPGLQTQKMQPQHAEISGLVTTTDFYALCCGNRFHRHQNLRRDVFRKWWRH